MTVALTVATAGAVELAPPLPRDTARVFGLERGVGAAVRAPAVMGLRGRGGAAAVAAAALLPSARLVGPLARLAAPMMATLAPRLEAPPCCGRDGLPSPS